MKIATHLLSFQRILKWVYRSTIRIFQFAGSGEESDGDLESLTFLQALFGSHHAKGFTPLCQTEQSLLGHTPLSACGCVASSRACVGPQRNSFTCFPGLDSASHDSFTGYGQSTVTLSLFIKAFIPPCLGRDNPCR